MRKIFLTLTVMAWSFLYSQTQFECIGLGTACSTAAALHAFNLRNAAYPFDWVISDFPYLYATLSDDFRDYLNQRYFRIREDNHGIINRYGITFVHDFPTIHYTGNNIQNEDLINENILSPEWLNALPLIQEKYARRINRFIEKCRSNNKIYFFRHFSLTRDEAIQLRNLLQSKYPNLDFVLVVVNSNPTYAQQWDIQKIKNYYLNDTQVWNDVREWQRIFNDLGLLSEGKIPTSLMVRKYAEKLCGHCDYCQRKKMHTT